jgi:hypothetical protein
MHIHGVSVHGISVGMSEAEYVRLSALIAGGAVLCGDMDKVHPEYIRGVAEMIMMVMCWSGDEVAGITNAIYEKAKGENK